VDFVIWSTNIAIARRLCDEAIPYCVLASQYKIASQSLAMTPLLDSRPLSLSGLRIGDPEALAGKKSESFFVSDNRSVICNLRFIQSLGFCFAQRITFFRPNQIQILPQLRNKLFKIRQKNIRTFNVRVCPMGYFCFAL
jgi:hypothetical protein